MKKSNKTSSASSYRAGGFLEQHSRVIIIVALVITLLLTIPLLIMGNDEQASQDPKGEVFELRDDVNERFAPSVHGAAYIVESRTGDILTQSALWELYQNEKELRELDENGELAPERLPVQSYLYNSFDVEANRPFLGVYTIADAVYEALEADPRFPDITLENATDDQVKLVVHLLLADEETSGLRESLSVKAVSEKSDVAGIEIDRWISPALNFAVLADNDRLGGGTLDIGASGGENVQNKEEFNRNVQRILRGDEKTYQLWGIGIDVNLEAADEGQTAGYFIMATVIAVVLVAGVSLRSYWAVALTGAGLGILMIWLKAISNLIGLKGGLIVDMIVPIAMISLGVDFALHALRRYGEEKSRGYSPGVALRVGFAGVLGALVLAMASDSIAFLSNTSSGIESVIQFGIAAGIAVISSFIVLGVVIPLVMMHIDQLLGPSEASNSRKGFFMTILNSVGVAALAGTGVIFLVAVSEPLGIAVILGTIIGYLVVPLIIMKRRKSRHVPETVFLQSEERAPTLGAPSGWFVEVVAGIARYRLVVLLVVAAITAASVLYAIRLEASFDVKDFFDSKSDFVTSLDKVDEHIGESGGEPGIIYIKGDLTDLGALTGIEQFILNLDDNPNVARRADGNAQIWPGYVVDLLKRITGNEYALGQIKEVTGVEIEDNDEDGLPDSQSQVEAAYSYMLDKGVPVDENILAYTPDEVREVLFHNTDGGEEDVTILYIGIPGTREQQTVIEAQDAIIKDMKVLDDSSTITRTGLTGSPFTRLAQLDATTRTLQRSMPIAAAAVLLLLLIAMRSFRYSIVTIIPIGLVVAWLYGLMYLTGFSLNYVTAIIGSISLGVGIDYSIHVTERFREEMSRSSSKMQALRRAANGTGVALLASAVSSIVGFAIMGFAPMPMFSSYGILTAIMIFFALAASLAVLPSLLLVVTPEIKTESLSEESGT